LRRAGLGGCYFHRPDGLIRIQIYLKEASMKKQLSVVLSVLVILITLLALAVSPAQIQAQAPVPESPDAIAPGAIPIQGKLTNASGVPLTGTYDIAFRLYDAETGGNNICGDVVSVTVTNGLFSSYMDHCYGGKLTGQKVWLGIQVAGDAEMTPRQVIFAVPYALGLVPGGVIESSWNIDNVLAIQTSYSSNSALHVAATSATGTNYGIYATAASAAGMAGYFYNSGGGTGISSTSLTGTGVFAGSLGTALVASGGTTSISAEGSGIIKSSATSTVWISGNSVRAFGQADPTIINMDSIGGARVFPGAAGVVRNVIVPITITSPLYGQSVRITDLDIFWKGDDEFVGISAVLLRRQVGVCETAGDVNCFVVILNAHPAGGLSCDKGEAPTGCTAHYDLVSNNVLTSSSGILYLTLELNYGDNTWIQIGGVRLTLEHD
jgi:hypothetical protein